MTKKSLVHAIAAKLGITQRETGTIVQQIFDAIVNAMVEDGGIELRNFGVFTVRRRKPRKARNPRTGESVMVPERHVVTFKPGRVMEQRIAEEGARYESAR